MSSITTLDKDNSARLLSFRCNGPLQNNFGKQGVLSQRRCQSETHAWMSARERRVGLCQITQHVHSGREEIGQQDHVIGTLPHTGIGGLQNGRFSELQVSYLDNAVAPLLEHLVSEVVQISIR